MKKRRRHQARFNNKTNTNKATLKARTSQSQVPDASVQDDIAQLAYALWQQRGCPYGSSEADWHEAERELRQSPEHVSR